MNFLACVKRVPDIGAKITLTQDALAIETRNLGFTVSPHEECAVEEVVRAVETHGGTSTVLTLGPPEAEEQIRDALARGIERGILLETDGSDWAPMQTAEAIAEAVRADQAKGHSYDVLVFGTESADSGGFQVGIRIAHALDLPCVMGVIELEFRDGMAIARCKTATGWEVYEVPLPALIGVKEGINLPRHPSLRGRMRSKKQEIDVRPVIRGEAGLELLELVHPPDDGKQVEMLGSGAGAAPKVVDLLKELGLVR